MTEVLIVVTRELKVGKVNYTFCDKFPLEQHLLAGDFDDRVGRFITDARQAVPLTRHDYERHIVQRPKGCLPRGFTFAELVERGIIDKAPKTEPKAEPAPALTGEVGELIPHGAQFYRVKKVGNFTLYDAVNKDGELLRETPFRKVDTVKAFIDGLAPA